MPPGETTKEAQTKKAGRSSGRIKTIDDETKVGAKDDAHLALLPSFRKASSKPYTLKEFSRLWRDAEVSVGKTTELEKQKSFRKTRSTEQYGRMLPKGMKVSVMSGGGIVMAAVLVSNVPWLLALVDDFPKSDGIA